MPEKRECAPALRWAGIYWVGVQLGGRVLCWEGVQLGLHVHTGAHEQQVGGGGARYRHMDQGALTGHAY